MPRGGARSRSGPAPDPEALRRDRADDRAEWVELPAAGRTGRVPAWPLNSKASARERRLWNKLWKLPQAIEWERLQLHDQLALYVRTQVEAEEAGAPASMRNAAVRMADTLGVSTAGMRANRWRVAPAQQGGRASSTSAGRKPRRSTSSAKDRFTVVDGG
ncbi:MAG: hypothetical protein ACODAF_01495 [Actinomycetota bacterium]